MIWIYTRKGFKLFSSSKCYPSAVFRMFNSSQISKEFLSGMSLKANVMLSILHKYLFESTMNTSIKLALITNDFALGKIVFSKKATQFVMSRIFAITKR